MSAVAAAPTMTSRERVLAVGGDPGLVAAAVEVGLDQLGVGCVIIGDEDGGEFGHEDHLSSSPVRLNPREGH